MTSERAEPVRHLSVRQAAFIGVGSMVGAGIFALLGSAGAVAGAGVWLSFLIAHIRIRHETGASLAMLLVADLATVVVLVSFTVTTLVDEPGTLVAMVVILVLSVVLDLAWKSRSASRPAAAT